MLTCIYVYWLYFPSSPVMNLKMHIFYVRIRSTKYIKKIRFFHTGNIPFFFLFIYFNPRRQDIKRRKKEKKVIKRTLSIDPNFFSFNHVSPFRFPWLFLLFWFMEHFLALALLSLFCISFFPLLLAWKN